MSVINKMLRDLDSRQTSATPVNAALNQGRGLARGTSVLIPTASPNKRGWMTFATVALVLAALAAGLAVWWQTQGVAKAPPQIQAVITPTALPTPAPMPAPTPVLAPVPAPVPAPMVASSAPPVAVPPVTVLPAAAVSAPTPVAVATPAQLPATPATAANAVTPAPAQAKLALPVAAPKLRAANELTPPPSPKVEAPARPAQATTPPNAVAPVSVPVPAATPARQSAALDALAQAQSLWTAGARDAATEVLREAIALAERQGSGANAALVPLARELARMLIAQSQNVQALDLLTRLEPALSGQADLWAVRGNAAQRLGRHPDAASAYLTALKLRPGEPRWMLGAAISLAIQGQLAEAGDLTEQARSKGALSPELRAYLRQLGIAIRD